MDATTYKPKIEILSDPDSLAKRTVDIFVSEVEKVLSKKDLFFVALSGGHTPKHFFELLGTELQSLALPWDKIHLFWVDERYVPADSPQSNYKLAADTFLGRVPVPQENIHRIPTEYSDFNTAAKRYEEIIKVTFKLEKGKKPEFDLIILGMGPDGHTGSLFPNSYATFDTDDLACVVYVLDEKLNRITLTHPVLCAAKRLLVLVSGKEKTAILKEVMTTEPDEVRYPIHTLWPVLNKVTWLVDSDAASRL
ncbi:MAG: 6-phosphogluconolactonase [Sedimentisphaerales bacterium]